jgi:predicted aldo/keto reductase-like oxidoreductase
MGVIAMKTYFRGLAAKLPGINDLEPFFRFALSHPVATADIGCDSLQQLEDNVRFASSFTPLSADKMENLRGFIAPYAQRLMYYKH